MIEIDDDGKFQFHNGSIKSDDGKRDYHYQVMFQFHNGSIKRV